MAWLGFISKGGVTIRLFQFLVRQFDKLKESPGLVKDGYWRVLYNDGEFSRTSTYDVAQSYADAFGGEVIHTRFHDPCKLKEEALMAALSKYDKPQEVSDVDLAFPAKVVGVLIPKREDLPDEFRKNYHHNEYCEMAQKWFFGGIDPLVFNEGIDAKMAMRHIQACLGSFEPSHEEKIGGAGFLLSRWGARVNPNWKKPEKPQKQQSKKKGKKGRRRGR